jgi:hypothetical protein
MSPLEAMAEARPRYRWEFLIVTGKGYHLYRIDLEADEPQPEMMRFYPEKPEGKLQIHAYQEVVDEAARLNRIEMARASLRAIAEAELPKGVCSTDSGLIEMEFARICAALAESE